MRPVWLWLLSWQFFLVSLVYAHGDLHEQIEAVTRQIKRSPRDARLHLKRGELHRAHGDWERALADYNHAARLDSALDAVLFARGRTLLQAGRFKEARTELNQFLEKHPDDREALLTRARTLAKLNEHQAAAEDYTRAIEHSDEPRPEYFLERAEALTRDGRIMEALQGIETGLKDLGPVLTLQLGALDAELNLQRFDAALARVDSILVHSPRKESWLARRGEILERAGRFEHAREAYTAALTSLESLPLHLRKTKATRELEARLRQVLMPSPPKPGRPAGSKE